MMPRRRPHLRCPTVPRRIFLPLTVAAALLLGACGDDDDADTTTDTTVDAGGSSTDDTPSGSSTSTPVEVGGDLDEKPEIELNGQEPVDELLVVDVVEGDGEEVPAGATVEVHYVGLTLDGNQFDSSWDRGETISFSLNQVIRGWTDGIPGMKVGGRRLLVIPGDQAYGPAGNAGAGIGPDATLVFVVDLVGIR